MSTAIIKKFDFKRGACGLEIMKDRNKATIILTEIADNWGTSITHDFERVATQVYNQFLSDLSVYNLTWIEHYNQNSYKNAGDDPETFAQVLLSWNPKTKQFHNPKWQPYLEKWGEPAQGRFSQVATSTSGSLK